MKPRKTALLVAALALLLLAPSLAQDAVNDPDTSELSRVKADLKACRKRVIGLEDANDECIAQVAQMGATITEANNKLTDLGTYAENLQVGDAEYLVSFIFI